jgi:hypothetical protein
MVQARRHTSFRFDASHSVFQIQLNNRIIIQKNLFMIRQSQLLFSLLLLFLISSPVSGQGYLRLNGGYLEPSGEFADKSLEENSGMAGQGYSFSVDFTRIYGSGLGWSVVAGRHTNTMDISNLQQMAEEEFGGEWNVEADNWSYYFVMPGLAWRYPWWIDVEVVLSAGYVSSVSPAVRADYTLSGQSDQLELPESRSEALAVMPALRFSYSFQNWFVSLNASTFLARPKFKVTLLDGERYNVKQYIINYNAGVGLGYRF